ncbi:MAG: hypothetical protein U1E73_05905 [Planctomycetota bacterium]
MIPVTRLAATAAVLSCLPSLLPAQGPNAIAPAPAAIPFPADSALTDVTADGTIWAAGERWKASFGADGVAFVPFLGSELPSQPVRFAFAGATVGGTAIRCEPAVARLHDRRVDYARGGVVECYDLRPDGVEQTFRFDSLPARGELVLGVDVTTALAFGRDGADIAFTRAEGGVRYGRATAIDGAGRRREVATLWSGAALRIVVPADFVATAALPLTIDPVIGAVQTVQTSTAALSHVGLAYDRSLGRFCACYERAFSAIDHDVYVALLDTDMQFQSLLTIDFSSAYWTKPRIAALEASDSACVIAETSTANTSPLGISCRIFTVGPVVTALPAQTITPGTYHDCHDPDVAGNSTGDPAAQFLVTWGVDDSSVNSSNLSLAHLDTAGNIVYVSPSLPLGIGFKRRPRLSRTYGTPGGGTEGFALVYRHEPYQQATGKLRVAFFDVYAQLRTVNGVYFNDLSTTTPNLGSDWAVSEPSDHDAGRFFVCAERRYDAATGAATIVAIPFDRQAAVPYGEFVLAGGGHDKRAPDIACDGKRFAVAYEEIYSATDSDVRVRTLRLAAGGVVQDDFALVTTSLDAETDPAICAMPDQLNRYGLAWQHTAGANSLLEAQVYRGIAAGGFTVRPTGCGGLTIQATGSPVIGEAATFTFANATGLSGFVAGAPVHWSLSACTGCQQGANGATLFTSTLQVTIPADPSYVGLTLAVQGFEFLPSGQPCLGQIAVSDTLDMRIQ